ncbi:hypothetical protein PENTCL1PPCAC_4860, partial [Pristionchus entomophagus]
SPQHFAAATLQPFGPFRNNDGLSNAYTHNLYEYEPRPTCPSCSGSKYLFCDSSHGEPRCAAKIRLNGVCTGYEQGEQPCYGGICEGVRCVDAVSWSHNRTISPERPIEFAKRIETFVITES